MKKLRCRKYLRKGWLALLRHPVEIVEFFGTVNAQPDEKIMLLKEARPLFGEQGTVRLKIVLYALARFLVLLFKFYDPLKERQAEHSGLAALPRKYDLFAILSFDVLADMGFKNFIRNAELARTSQQILLVQVIAVSAIQIAD